MYREISKCRVCGNPELDSILDLGMQALTGVFPGDRNAQVPVTPLELVKCREDSNGKHCGLVQLRHSCDPLSLYGGNYGYRSGINGSMVGHLKCQARKIKERLELRPGDLVLDIGSNDSTLLKAMDEPGLKLVGMDPTGVKFREYYPDHVRLISDFFSSCRFRKEFGREKAKVVTSIAMFYDLEAPVEFMQQVRDILADDGIWVFEQSYLPTMLAMNAYDTVCQEHVEYYGLKQILWMAERAGLKILDVELNQVNGGSFSVTAAKEESSYEDGSAAVDWMLRQESHDGLGGMEIYRQFQDRVFEHRDQLLRRLDQIRQDGEVVFGYGASTKGNVVLQFCGITPEQLPFIAEVNADKFGSFTPQTLIPIISEEDARRMKPDGFLVLPWHFKGYIVQREQAFLASGGKLIFPLPTIEVIENEHGVARRL